jgi:hypothetical protein
MSKKPKRSRHRVPPQALGLHSDPIDEHYAHEVERATSRLERQYRQAQLALEKAQSRVAPTPRTRSQRRQLAEVRRLEIELEELAQLLSAERHPCDGSHRVGVHGLRPPGGTSSSAP